MKPVDYVAIVIRFLAIFLVLYSLVALEKFVAIFSYSTDAYSPNAGVALLNVVIPVLIAVVLWMFPNLVARKITGKESQTVSPLNAHSTLSVLIAAIGVFTFFYAFADAWYWIILSSMMEKVNPSNPDVTFLSDTTAQMWVTGIELVLSLILIFKCKTIANFIIKVSR